MKIEKILREAVDAHASDIYITTGAPPTFRVHGELVPLKDHPPLTDETAREYLTDTMTEAQQQAYAALS